MAGDLNRVASKAGTLNGSKDMRVGLASCGCCALLTMVLSGASTRTQTAYHLLLQREQL